jgi:ribosomal protein S28E/S33
MASNINHYSALGIPVNATNAQIKNAYRAKALNLHPNKNPGRNTTAEFQKMKQSYNVLKDPTLRSEYNRTRRNRSSRAGAAGGGGAAPVNRRTPAQKHLDAMKEQLRVAKEKHAVTVEELRTATSFPPARNPYETAEQRARDGVQMAEAMVKDAENKLIYESKPYLRPCVAGEIPKVEIKIVSGRLVEQSGQGPMARDEILRHIADGWTLPNGFPIDTPIYTVYSPNNAHNLYVTMWRQSCGVKIVKQDIKLIVGDINLDSPEPFIRQINENVKSGWVRYKDILMASNYRNACQIMTKNT